MGLIRSALGAAESTIHDGYKDYFYCEALPEEVLMAKGIKRNPQHTLGQDNNIITNGSTIAVADGQAMMIVDQGAIAEFCAEPGEFVYDASTEPCLFTGGLKETLSAAWETFKKRFVTGGEPAHDQRIYYFNLKEIMGNKYGTQNPVPFHIIEPAINFDGFISVRLNGEYSYKITNPILFYKNVAGNVSGEYRREELESTLKSELLTALQPALGKVAEKGIHYAELPGHAADLCEALNDELSAKWRDLRGIEIASFAMNSVTASPEDEETLKLLQKAAALKDPSLAAGLTVDANATAIKDAAKNPNGAAAGILNVGMVNQYTGTNAADLYAAAGNQPSNTWTCSCGKENDGNFCTNCGKPRPAVGNHWKCECGAENDGNFCTNCGKAKPE